MNPPLPSRGTRQYGESPNGRVAHIYRHDEDKSRCGVELVRGVTSVTAWTLCRKCERASERDRERCPTCGGLAHVLDSDSPAFKPKGARARLAEAWDREDKLGRELDGTYAHLRAVIENCKHSPADAIRHQLVGLLPEGWS